MIFGYILRLRIMNIYQSHITFVTDLKSFRIFRFDLLSKYGFRYRFSGRYRILIICRA